MFPNKKKLKCQNMLYKNISYNNLVVLDWMIMIVVKLGLHKERHTK